MAAPVLSEIREQVMVKLRLDPEDADLVTYWIKQAYADVIQYTGFNLDEVSIAVSLTAGDGHFTLPSEVAWIRHLQFLYQDGTLSRPAQQVRMEEVLTRQQLDEFAGQLEGGHVYAVGGQDIVHFWPLAIAGQQVCILHTELPVADLGDTESPLMQEPFGSKLLEYGALVEGAKFKKDPLMADFEQSYAMWMGRYVGWLNRRKGGSSTAFEVWDGAYQVDRLERESEHWSGR
jgi:hypothetical protein